MKLDSAGGVWRRLYDQGEVIPVTDGSRAPFAPAPPPAHPELVGRVLDDWCAVTAGDA